MDLSPDQVQLIVNSINHAMLTVPRCWGPPQRIVLGRNVHTANTLFNTMSGMIRIGDDTFFGHNASVLTGTHDFRKRRQARHAAIPDLGRDIVIGKGVWICSNVTILGPCTIGDDAVIAAGSLVLGGELAGGYIHAGTPAKPIKPIDFTDELPPGA